MRIIGDSEELEREALERAGAAELGFKRHLLVPGAVIALAELVLVVLPMWNLFELGETDKSTLLRIGVPVLVGVLLVWMAAVAAYLAPIHAAVAVRKRGKRIPRDLAARAYEKTLRVPLRVLILRTALWVFAAASIGTFLVRYAGWPWLKVAELTSLVAMHALVVNVVRAVWYASILARIRFYLFPGRSRLERFAEAYFRRLVLVAAVVWGSTVAAISAILYYFLPISLEQYLRLQTYFPSALAVGVTVWIVVARRRTRELRSYIDAELGETSSGADHAAVVYRSAQALPYHLALTSMGIWAVIIAIGAWVARSPLRFELDDTILMIGVSMLTAIGTSIYESLWHRETMQPLLGHLALQHRLPVRSLAPSMSLRTKLLLSFGGVVLLACGLALFWGFMQYKNLVTGFVSQQAELSLDWLRSEIKGATTAGDEPPTVDVVRTALENMDHRGSQATAVFYYLPAGASSADQAQRIVGTAAHNQHVPALPWYALALMSMPYDGPLDLGASLGMSGRHGRLMVRWHDRIYDLGAVAVLYPDYRRGEASVRPLKELLLFFLALFGACAGIVTLTVGQFVRPIRKLERRADGMARGELAEPVSSGGEGDEVGRLTYALEEMRRALRDKLRSTEEVNLDLERAVQRRTADLAKKNRELAEAIDKLTRTQDQLVRSEKMASIGQLVAGIAHEINNPVNAIVNTVEPLEEAIDAIGSASEAERREAAGDVRDMLRVIQRGAQRTKAIVQALHNYSRTDDEQLVDFELNRSIDDSLELLRHLLKQTITVERDYHQVGRIRGHAGQLNQVFMNLLTNAAQALSGREGAIIGVVTRSEDSKVVIGIRDNGPGIPPEVLPRIFDPFFTTKDVGEGTGLGLSIVHGLVERHGGTIEVESEPGVGTTFTVTLPRDPARSVSVERKADARG